MPYSGGVRKGNQLCAPRRAPLPAPHQEGIQRCPPQQLRQIHSALCLNASKPNALLFYVVVYTIAAVQRAKPLALTTPGMSGGGGGEG
jgi:hypothetical protein